MSESKEFNSPHTESFKTIYFVVIQKRLANYKVLGEIYKNDIRFSSLDIGEAKGVYNEIDEKSYEEEWQIEGKYLIMTNIGKIYKDILDEVIVLETNFTTWRKFFAIRDKKDGVLGWKEYNALSAENRVRVDYEYVSFLSRALKTKVAEWTRRGRTE
jgi:hypothetical protein